MVKVTIDREGCISCGNCWTTCPDFFEPNPEDNQSQIIEKFRRGSIGEGEAPNNQQTCVKEAEKMCPVQGIYVE